MKRRHFSKKGFELSVGFIVILIITLVIFTSSIFIVNKFFVQTREIEDTISTEAQTQIERLIAQGQSVVVVPNVVTTTISKGTTAGIGFSNVYDTKNFYVVLGLSSAFDEREQEIVGADPTTIRSWVLYHYGPYELSKAERQTVSLVIEPGSEISKTPKVATKKGTYVFNVCVFTDTIHDPIAEKAYFQQKELDCGMVGSAGGNINPSNFGAYLGRIQKLQVIVE